MAEKRKSIFSRKERPPRQEWEPKWYLQILRWLWMAGFAMVKVAIGAVATVVLIGVVCMLVFVGILGSYLQDTIIPSADMSLEGLDLDQTSFIYYLDSNGEIQLERQIHTTIDRQWATYEEIPEDLIHAAVAIEDHRFYEHQGVDWVTTIKACGGMFFGGGDLAGGSTITQQLVKNIKDEKSITVQRKVQEIFRAILLEKEYDKKTILEEYLNYIYLGEDCYGVKSAAATYFGKELQNLTLAECASLISITNNPSLFDPYIGFDDSPDFGKINNRNRQLDVLWAMYDYGWITREEYDEAKEQEMVFKSGIREEDRLAVCPDEDCGFSGTIGELITQGDAHYCPDCGALIEVAVSDNSSMYTWFDDTVLEDVAEAFAALDGVTDPIEDWPYSMRSFYMDRIKRGGYHIFTTFDPEVQKAVDAVYQDLSRIPEVRSGQQLQSAIVVVDNRTGDIVAMAGGVGEKMFYDEFNRATESTLQTGSSIKPLTVYAPAFEAGVISPATVIKDLPMNYDDGAFPLNFERDYNYHKTVLNGVMDSVNAVAVNVLDMVGTGYSFNYAKNYFGLRGLVEDYTSDYGYHWSDVGYAPLGLGALSFGVTVRDMTCAFATFANHGTYRLGRTFTKVYDSDGNLVIDNTQVSRDILSKKTVDYMNYCLYNAVVRGTGTEADLNGMVVCGKSGTTSDNYDRWFCGYTGYYTAAVWVGYDSPETINQVYSYIQPAAYLWHEVMAPLHEGKDRIELIDYDPMYYTTVCLDSGLSATEACSKDIRMTPEFGGESFKRTESVRVYYEDIPENNCYKHVLVDYCMTGRGVATEYCIRFQEAMKATEQPVKIEQHSLVRMTQKEIDELLKAEDYHLNKNYLIDNYVYFIHEDGTPGVFKGIHGNLDQKTDAPYLVCPVHTKEAWEKYQKEQEALKPTEDPTKPTGPNQPQDPTQPTTPGQPTEPTQPQGENQTEGNLIDLIIDLFTGGNTN